jgi:hypothetical protein
VDFTVTFSEFVTGVDIHDFTLTTTGVTNASVTAVTPVSETTYTVTVNTGKGNGTIRLDVADDDTIVDAASNPLGGLGAGNGDFSAGQGYTKFQPFYSAASNDGWVLESSEFSNLANTKSNSGTLRVGDDAKNRQYRSLLYFDTASLPNNAVISKVIVKIKKAGVAGTDPFTTHGNLVADMKNGTFGLSPLELIDFNAAGAPISSAGSFGDISGGWYQLTLSPVNFKYINLSGVTQFRLRFTRDDDNDKKADYISFYSGDDATHPPQLVIEYIVP